MKLRDIVTGWVNGQKKSRTFSNYLLLKNLSLSPKSLKFPIFNLLFVNKERLQGKPVADPFVIAKAKVLKGCVITQESKKPNAAHIPNVCEYFSIDCLNLEGFMEREDWIF